MVNVNDMEFSDDEQEREFKNRNKRGKKGRRKCDEKSFGAAVHGQGANGSSYTGFHAPQSAAHPSSRPMHYAPMVNQPIQYQAAPGINPHQQSFAYPQQSPLYAHGPPGYANFPYPRFPPPPPQYPYPYAQPQAPANPNQGSEGPSNGDDGIDTVYYD